MTISGVMIDLLHLAEVGVVVEPVARAVVEIDAGEHGHIIVVGAIDVQATEGGRNPGLAVFESCPVVRGPSPRLANCRQVARAVIW